MFEVSRKKVSTSLVSSRIHKLGPCQLSTFKYVALEYEFVIIREASWKDIHWYWISNTYFYFGSSSEEGTLPLLKPLCVILLVNFKSCPQSMVILSSFIPVNANAINIQTLSIVFRCWCCIQPNNINNILKCVKWLIQERIMTSISITALFCNISTYWFSTAARYVIAYKIKLVWESEACLRNGLYKVFKEKTSENVKQNKRRKGSSINQQPN